MTQPRVIIPRISVSFEDTRKLFGLSASDATGAARLVDLAFESSQMRAMAKAQRKRKATAKQAASAAGRGINKRARKLRPGLVMPVDDGELCAAADHVPVGASHRS